MQVSVFTCPFPVQPMSLKDGDLMLVRLPQGTDEEFARQILGRILDSIRTVDQIQVHVVAAIGDYEVEHLNEESMRKYGWVKADGAS